MFILGFFFLKICFINLEFPSLLSFLRVFIMNGYWVCLLLFLHQLVCLCDFFLILLSVWWVILIDFWVLNLPCIAGINPTWSCSIITSIFCWILFASILLRIVASRCRRGIILWFPPNFFWYSLNFILISGNSRFINKLESVPLYFSWKDCVELALVLL